MACPSLIASLSVLPLTCHVGVVNNHEGPQGKENKRSASLGLQELGVRNDEIGRGGYDGNPVCLADYLRRRNHDSSRDMSAGLGARA
jgi:hypothetical protein